MPRRFGGDFPPWWHGRFRGCGYRITVPRQEILNVLAGTDDHLTAEDIYMKAHKIHPAIGLTTVYRTLELLVEMGVVVKFDVGDGKARYELAIGPKGPRHHHHLICNSCGRVVDYTDFVDEERDLIKKTQDALSKRYNFKILNHQIQFMGLCDKCR